ncbi:hypothetical protein CH063_09480 [Colletotrichum higginsianum]|uniref:Uncharacterized protein n=1 Tax=Colletotrichum higginsianum (strain IMI 349063) TaxID=759273 RepID=H1VDS8_COLHI|nr:hypothetical protein CH063_09480 [Colletotrichum higginsianum]
MTRSGPLRVAHKAKPERPDLPVSHEVGGPPHPGLGEQTVGRGGMALVRGDPVDGAAEGAHGEHPGWPDGAPRVGRDREAVEGDVAAAGGAHGVVADLHGRGRGDAVGCVGQTVVGQGADVRCARGRVVVEGGRGPGLFD